MPNFTTLVSTDGLRYICQEANNDITLHTEAPNSNLLSWPFSFPGICVAAGVYFFVFFFSLLIVHGLLVPWTRCQEKMRQERLVRDTKLKENKVRGLMEDIIQEGKDVLRYVEEVKDRDKGIRGCFEGEEGWVFADPK